MAEDDYDDEDLDQCCDSELEEDSDLEDDDDQCLLGSRVTEESLREDIFDAINAFLVELDDSDDPNDAQRSKMISGVSKVLDIITGARNKCYGAPRENHGCTGAIWTAYLKRRGLLSEGAVIDGRDVCNMMEGLKISRDAHWRQDDNQLDCAGYAFNALACMVE